MSSRHLRRRGAVSGAVLALLAGLVLAVIGLVFLVQGIRAADQGFPLEVFGIAVESAVPGVILLVIAAVIAIGSLVALGGGGRTRRSYVSSGVTAWTVQPPPGVKEFGNPPPLPSHRAELAAAGLEAFPIAGGQWHVRRTVR